MALPKSIPSHGWTSEAVERSRIMAGPNGSAYLIRSDAFLHPFVVYARSALEAATMVQINRRPFYRMGHNGAVTATNLDDCDDCVSVAEDEIRGRE